MGVGGGNTCYYFICNVLCVQLLTFLKGQTRAMVGGKSYSAIPFYFRQYSIWILNEKLYSSKISLEHIIAGRHLCLDLWRGEEVGESEDQVPLNAQQGFQLQSLAPRQRDACTTAPRPSPLPTHQMIFALRVGVVASRHNPCLRFLWVLITTKIFICVVVPWSGLFCQGPSLRWTLLWKGILGSQLLHTLLH